ncbi:glycosyltransferase family 9 protein [Salidesulfovibrio brasiliensis]|uniref:glycosyltransferase family 9 protein n=1 Tax=Salidesulfovibrio brasiliensis TaxID=221711 RepID=UPI0006D04A85|nr:glycosyltransferase family 9 protein [Salidesulfovibrio brasiliensis]
MEKPILVLQMQRMGDLILSFPLFLWLGRLYPNREILVAAEEGFYKPLMPLSPKVTYIPWHGVNVLKKRDYHLIVNLSIQEKAARLCHDLNAERKLGPSMDEHGARFVHGTWQLYRSSLVKNNRYNRFHWADLNALDAVPQKRIADTRFDIPRTLPKNVNKVGLFLGASEAAKRPTPQFWADLVRDLLGRGLRPMLFGGPAEVELGEEVTRLSNAPALNLCGKLGLDELSAVGQTLALFITPDTGPMHLAAWTGLKCLNLSMGNVNPWETGPYTPGHYVLRADMDCAKGCWHCDRDRLECHGPFDPKRVAALASRMAAGTGHEGLARMRLPDLALYRTGNTPDGLYHLERLDDTPPDEERVLSAFWQSFFGNHHGLWSDERARSDWQTVRETCPEAAESLLGHLPETGRQFRHGVAKGELLTCSFWETSPREIRPFTGLSHMMLENGDFRPQAWRQALAMLERLIDICR